MCLRARHAQQLHQLGALPSLARQRSDDLGKATHPPVASLAKHQIADHLRLHAGKHQLSRRAAALIGEHGRELVQQRLLGAHSIGNFSPCSLAQAMASG